MSLIFIWKENLKPANCHLQTVNPENTMTKRYFTKRVWRYQSGNQNSYIEEEQTTHWSKENVQKDKQRSTKHTYKTKDRVTRTPQYALLTALIQELALSKRKVLYARIFKLGWVNFD